MGFCFQAAGLVDGRHDLRLLFVRHYDHDKFLFVSEPIRKQEAWKNYIP